MIQTPGNLRRRVRPVAAVVLALVALPLVVSAVFGHNPEISAKESCNTTVTFTASAWEGTHGEDQEASRTNPEIGISWSSDGGTTWTDLPQSANYHFDSGNGYWFTDSFDAGDAASVIVRARALADWGNGYVPIVPDDDRQTGPITKPGDCASPSTSPSESPSTSPSESPSTSPSESPSTSPSESPSTSPSESPSTSPSESPSTSPSESPSGGVGGETGSPRHITPPPTSLAPVGSSSNSGGLQIVLVALIGLAAVSLLVLPDRKARNR